MSTLLDAPVRGAYHLVSWLASVCQPFLGQSATACAIVLCTVLVRLLLHPLSRAGVRGEQARAALAPRLSELRRRYGNDPRRLSREIAALQAETGSSLYAGMLPTFAQLPFFYVLYRLFSTPVLAGEPNGLLSGSLFGASLGTHWPVLTGTPAYLVLAVALAVVAWFSSRWQSRRTGDQPQRRSVRVLVRVLPFGTVATAAVIPLAAGLYLLTTTTWTFVERVLLSR